MEDPGRLVKTSLYVPARLLARVGEVAATREMSSAALIRWAITRAVDEYRPAPIGGFLSSGAPHRNTSESREEYD